MKTYVVRDSSGKLYALRLKPTETENDLYRQFAEDVLKMPDACDDDFDTGNVDIDVFEVSATPRTVEVVFEVD